MNAFNEGPDHLSPIERALRASRADAFDPGFSDRVMARWSRGQAMSLGRSMQRYFVWMTPALAAAILALAMINMRMVGRAGVGAALGLDPVTVATAYALDADSTRSIQ